MPLSRQQRETVEAARNIWERYVREFVVPDGDPVEVGHLRAFLSNLTDEDLMTMARGMSAMVVYRAEQELQILQGCVDLHAAAVRLIEHYGAENAGDAACLHHGRSPGQELDDYDLADAIDAFIADGVATAPTGRVWSPWEIVYLMEVEAAEAAGL